MNNNYKNQLIELCEQVCNEEEFNIDPIEELACNYLQNNRLTNDFYNDLDGDNWDTIYNNLVSMCKTLKKELKQELKEELTENEKSYLNLQIVRIEVAKQKDWINLADEILKNITAEEFKALQEIKPKFYENKFEKKNFYDELQKFEKKQVILNVKENAKISYKDLKTFIIEFIPSIKKEL